MSTLHDDDLVFDALVIGAGPAGSVAAMQLARAGARVALVDRHEFPRDKTCGDALIPDALALLERLSLKQTVLARARVLDGVHVYSPSGRAVTIRGECACIPRGVLDDILRRAATHAGAVFLPRHRLKSPIGSGVVCGASFATPDNTTLELRAQTTILATGAAAEALNGCGVCRRITPSAIAARAYFEVAPEVAGTLHHLLISYDREVCPGYGWLFPGPNNVLNVGVGCFCETKSASEGPNMRRLFDRFITAFTPVAHILRQARQLTPLKGAPLRTGLQGADLAAPGLLVCGEAAGLTYSLSGEGIGKAMESGAIAAEVIIQHRKSGGDAAMLANAYARRLRGGFAAQFDAYSKAQDWLSRPRLIDFLAWRATRSQFVSRQLEGIFQETVPPAALFSLRGLARALAP